MNDSLLIGLLILMTSSFCLIIYKEYAIKRRLPMGTLFINEKATLWGWAGLCIALLLIIKSGDWLTGFILGLISAFALAPIVLVFLNVYIQIAAFIGLALGVLWCLAS